MDMSSVTQLLNGVNNQNNNNQGNQSTIPQMPPVTPPDTLAPDTNFGSAAAYQPSNEAVSFTPDTGRVREMWSHHQTQVDSFRRMVETLINQQAERQGFSSGFSFRNIEVTDEMRAEAAEMVAEGGYFSIEETAARILDFAVALTGGDPSRIEVMRNAVERGFAQAERMFGGELPEISHRTREAVMNGFDEWAEAGNANAISLLNR